MAEPSLQFRLMGLPVLLHPILFFSGSSITWPRPGPWNPLGFGPWSWCRFGSWEAYRGNWGMNFYIREFCYRGRRFFLFLGCRTYSCHVEILDRGARSPAVAEIGTLEQGRDWWWQSSHLVGHSFIHPFIYYEPLRARPFDRYPGIQIN